MGPECPIRQERPCRLHGVFSLGMLEGECVIIAAQWDPILLHPDLVFWPLAGLRAACPPQRGQQGSLRDPL